MSTISFDEFRKRKPNVDVDSIMLQYDIVVAIASVREQTQRLLDEFFPTRGHDFLCSTAVANLRTEIVKMHTLWSEISNKSLLVSNRMERADAETLELGLQHRLTSYTEEIDKETQNALRRAEKLKKLADRRKADSPPVTE